jgi:DNA/RNA endonuclease YhcR with UshA esterase domain
MTRNILVFTLLLVTLGCTPPVPLFVTSPPLLIATMNVNECKISKICTIRGRVSVVKSDGVEMGEVKLNNGQCVTISISRNDIRYLIKHGPMETTLSGKVYREIHDPSFIILKIKGRKVGYPKCGDFYLFIN